MPGRFRPLDTERRHYDGLTSNSLVSSTLYPLNRHKTLGKPKFDFSED